MKVGHYTILGINMISVSGESHEETAFDVQVAILVGKHSWKAYGKVLKHYPTSNDIHDIAARGDKVSDDIALKSFWYLTTLHLEKF